MTYDVARHTFGWDSESPTRQVEVGPVRMEWRPVTNGEYLAFWMGVVGWERVALPLSWTDEGTEVWFYSLDHPRVLIRARRQRVRTLYGLIPMSVAKH